ncbi:MAG TPA: endonuclease [Elusimicrobiota bacterium]|nr:endonuclease [Elusimicrobiota bacterium]
MLPSRRLLAALLLAAVPLNAQVARVTAPSLTAIGVVPGAISVVPLSRAPAAVMAPTLAPSPFLSAPSLVSAPMPSLPVAAIPAAAAVAPAAAEVPAAAAALASVAPAAADGPKRGGAPVPGAAAPEADIASGDRLFDGSSDLKTRSGSVFAPSRTAHPAVRGGVTFVRVKPAPAAAVKPVPDTQGLSGSALLDRVGQIAAKGHHGHDYHEASHYLFATADNHAINGVHGVADAYSGVFIPGTSAAGADYSETGDPAHDGWSRKQGMNVEHVFPQSLFGQKLPMRSDLHHLMATFEHPNGMRGNLPFGVVPKGAPLHYRNDAGAKSDGRVFEPPDFTKGRVARAMLYFYARYKDEGFFDPHVAAFWDPQIETLLDWNRRFPPTVEERTRNDQVQAFQGNRNPFVDDAGLADRIGADALRAGPAPSRMRDLATAPEQIVRRSDKPRKGKKRKESYHRPHSSRRGSRR